MFSSPSAKIRLPFSNFYFGNRFVNLLYQNISNYMMALKLQNLVNHRIYKVLTLFNKCCSDRDRIRTCDRLLRRQMLYPAELRDHYSKNKINLIVYQFVGVAGFEPAASTSQTWRDNRATLHPETII